MKFFLCEDQPSFESRPSDVEAERGEEVSLLCKVLANPVPDIFWVFDPIDRVSVIFCKT